MSSRRLHSSTPSPELSQGDHPTTTRYVAEIVRRVLIEYALPHRLLRVAALPFSWEVTLQKPSGVTEHLIIPSGTLRALVESLRAALDPVTSA
jgi:hypothetical protein